MKEHIAYAMNNSEAVKSFVFFNNPFTLRTWTHNIIEIIVIAGALIGLLHAIKAYKRGEKLNLWFWVTCFMYGLILEVLSYNFNNSFWHGEFTVMFYHNRFPLYISLLYPALLYHTYFTVARFRLNELKYGILIESVCIGWVTMCVYLIFDNIGPQLHWWIWDIHHPDNQPMWSSVPATSYHWIYIFTIALSLMARLLLVNIGINKNRATITMVALCAAAAIGTIILGTLLFVPYNAVKAFMDANWAAALLAIYMFSGGLLFMAVSKSISDKPDWLLMIFPITWLCYHIALYCYLFETFLNVNSGLSNDGMPVGNIFMVVFGITCSIYVVNKACFQNIGRKTA